MSTISLIFLIELFWQQFFFKCFCLLWWFSNISERIHLETYFNVFWRIDCLQEKTTKTYIITKSKVQKCALQNRLWCRNIEWWSIWRWMGFRTGKWSAREFGKGYLILNNSLLYYVLRNCGKKGHIQGWPYQPHILLGTPTFFVFCLSFL